MTGGELGQRTVQFGEQGGTSGQRAGLGTGWSHHGVLCAGFASDQPAGRDIPGLHALLEISVHRARGSSAEITEP